MGPFCPCRLTLGFRGLALAAVLSVSAFAVSQSRLAEMPGADKAREIRSELSRGLRIARLSVRWTEEGHPAWQKGSGWVALNPVTLEERELSAAPSTERSVRRPGRGRQLAEVDAPSGGMKAVSKGGHVYLVKDGREIQVSKPEMGGPRIKHGQGSWVYGEELGQSDAMGFSADSKWLWFYRFDETEVKDTHLALSQATPQTRLEVEAYPKPGQPNPVVDLYVADTSTGSLHKVQVRPGDFDEGIGHYVYNIKWRPGSNKLIFHRLDRRHKVREICSWDPAAKTLKVLDREENPTAWVEDPTALTFMEDLAGARDSDLNSALILSESSGFTNLYRVNLEQGGRTALTRGNVDLRSIVRVDLGKREIDVMAISGSKGMRQLYRLNLATGQFRSITDPTFHHEVQIAPNGEFIVDRASNAATPPSIRLLNSKGEVLKVLQESDVSVLEAQKYPRPEAFTFKSADGVTMLNGMVHMPPSSYLGPRPILVQVYGGPLGLSADSWNEDFETPSNAADYGFAVVKLEVRGGGGRGRAFRNALYQNMGRIEIDDLAAGVKSLAGRSRLDLSRVGIEGTSYGGYASLMAVLRHPDVFHAAASQSCVSDWRNYDTIYTERYMGVLPESKEAYDAGSGVLQADKLKGWLMLYYGTADDNTHPSNTLQVIRALQRANKSFEVQVGVDIGHSGMNFARMMEFFIERLVIGRERA